MNIQSLLIGLLGLVLLTCGCDNDRKVILKKLKSRGQVESVVQETQRLEEGMRQMQELEKLDTQVRKDMAREEPVKPPTE